MPQNMVPVKLMDVSKSVRKGTLEVTKIDLIYSERNSTEPCHWPLKCLFKYSHDNTIFTFIAWRGCPGGEGAFTFWTKSASVVFDVVARKINQGNLQPPGEMSPLPSEVSPPDTSVLMFSRRCMSEQPSYQNMNLLCQQKTPIMKPQVEYHQTETSKSDSPPLANEHIQLESQETEVVFDKSQQEYPVTQPTPSTDSLVKEEKKERGVPLSDSSVSSQLSLTGRCCDVKRSREMGVRPGSPIPEPSGTTMCPIDVTLSQKSNYQHVSAGCEDFEKLTIPTPHLCSSPNASPRDTMAQDSYQPNLAPALECIQLDFPKMAAQLSVRSTDGRSHDPAQGSSVSIVPCADTSMVNCDKLNFSALEPEGELRYQTKQEALEKKNELREQEILEEEKSKP